MCGLQLWCIFRLENTDVFKTKTVNKLSSDLEALIERLLALIDDVLVSTTMTSMMFVLRVLLAPSLFHSPVAFFLISFSFLFSFSGKSYVALTKKTGEIQMEFDPLLPFPKYHRPPTFDDKLVNDSL